jgi:hypothetical protein
MVAVISLSVGLLEKRELPLGFNFVKCLSN